MKKVLIVFFFLTAAVFGQFRDQLSNRPKISDGIIKNNTPSLILGFFNPNNFQMHHSYSMSYSAWGGNGLAVGMYTNSMMYKFSDKLNVQVDASLMHTPYSSFGSQVADQINSIYISKAALNYRPSENFFINIQFSNNPYMYYSPFSRYYDPSFGSSSFFDDGFGR